MIILDENIHDQRILDEISTWYPGRVASITALRPRTVIKDDAIPDLLRQANQPTFITINVNDFWLRTKAHPKYCIVAIALPKERTREIPRLMQNLFHLAPFKTKSLRMGKVIRLTPRRVEYYQPDQPIRTLLVFTPHH